MFSFAALTDRGPVFEVNDDRILVGRNVIGSGEYSGIMESDHILLAVADGVGGLMKGYEAAEETLKMLSQLNRPGIERVDIKECVEKANELIRCRQAQLNMPDGLRSTLAALYVDGETVYVINAGDSRVYRFRSGELVQLSKDHSVVQNYIDMGEITEEESYSHPKKNLITKCIGNEERVNARIVDFSEDLRLGDMFILCSDGLSDCLRTREMRVMLNEDNKPLSELCRLLTKKAIEKGSTDNISICLMRKES